MGLTEKLKNENMWLWDKILNHKFILEMGEATLPLEKFTYYISQDSHYLDGLLKTFAYASAKAPSRDLTMFFAELIVKTVKGEIAMQDKIRLMVKVEPKPVNSVCKEYVEYLLKVGAENVFYEIVSSTLPCMWTYQLIGEKLKKSRGSRHKVYGIWIKEYSSKSYRKLVDKLRRIVDEAEEKLSQETLNMMRRHFKVCSEYELKFWDSSYNLQG
ncbi:MAG: thiaminase II [Candidatus Bathyarchaeota archaeon]|nr:thiaminase II [Candidatus Bathyarchaeota archaeon]